MFPPLTSKSNKNGADEPEAYQIGWVPFLGTKIFLDSKPLIPRTETEWWVEKVIAEAKDRPLRAEDGPLRVLDLFAGSGCVGVAVLKHIPNATVDFGELEARHLSTIQKNIAANADPARARVFKTDVWSVVPDSYDVVLANPPYLAQSRIERVQGSVLIHEPPEALFADDEGFALIAETFAHLPVHLTQGGQCWIEHEPEHAARIIESARRLGLSATVHKDQYGVERYSVILKP